MISLRIFVFILIVIARNEAVSLLHKANEYGDEIASSYLLAMTRGNNITSSNSAS